MSIDISAIYRLAASKLRQNPNIEFSCLAVKYATEALYPNAPALHTLINFMVRQYADHYRPKEENYDTAWLFGTNGRYDEKDLLPLRLAMLEAMADSDIQQIEHFRKIIQRNYEAVYANE